MNEDFIESLWTTCRSCRSLRRPDGARQLIGIFQRLGVRVLDAAHNECNDHYKYIKQNLNIIIPLCLDTPIINPFPPFSPPIGLASFVFVQSSQTVLISQAIRSNSINEIYKAHLAFMRILNPQLMPEYGSIDVKRESLRDPKETADAVCPLAYIYWGNIFGPAYVSHYGRDFLLGAPGWKVEELDDGGILYVTTESYLPWWHDDQSEILRYFRTKAPKVRLYRTKPSPDRTG